MDGWFILSAVSTCVIAVFSIVNFFLAWSIRAKNDEYQNQVSDLFQAIVISNIIGPEARRDEKVDHNIRQFKEKYKGKTPIFK